MNKIHDELIADFKAIQNKIDDYAKAESAAQRAPRQVLLHQVRGKCDGAINILNTDKSNVESRESNVESRESNVESRESNAQS